MSCDGLKPYLKQSRAISNHWHSAWLTLQLGFTATVRSSLRLYTVVLML